MPRPHAGMRMQVRPVCAAMEGPYVRTIEPLGPYNARTRERACARCTFAYVLLLAFISYI